MLCEYSHTKSESLAQIRNTMGEIQHFSRGLFFILAYPVNVTIFGVLVNDVTQSQSDHKNAVS